jgi:hypothetical protein
MYDTNYTCTYNKSDIFLKEEEVILSEEDKEDIREELYRQDLLNIFNLEEYDGKLIDEKMQSLYEKLKSCEFLVNCMSELAAKWLTNDKVVGLMILFSFDYMHAAHICICEYLVSGKISHDNETLLTDLL